MFQPFNILDDKTFAIILKIVQLRNYSECTLESYKLIIKYLQLQNCNIPLEAYQPLAI